MAVSIERNLPAVNFSGNPMVLRVSSNNFEDSGIPRPFFAIFCSIYLEDPSGEGTPEPVHVESIQVDASGHGLFDLSDVLSGYTKPTLPFPLDFTVQAVKDEEAAVRFWIELYEGYGIPFVKQAVAINSKANYLAIPGGFSDTILQQIEEGESNQYAFLNANKLFLSNQPEYKRVANLQPETLRWFNCSEEQVSAKLICKQYSFIGEDAVTEQLWSGTLDALSLYTFNVTPGIIFELLQNTDSWEIYITNSSDAVISEKIIYRTPDLPVPNVNHILFQNSLGGFDTLRCEGAMAIETEGNSPITYRPIVTTFRKALMPEQDRPSINESFKGSVGYLSSQELDWLTDFRLSEQRYLLRSGRLENMVLTNAAQLRTPPQPPGTFDIEALIGVSDFFFSRLRGKYSFPPVISIPTRIFITGALQPFTAYRLTDSEVQSYLVSGQSLLSDIVVESPERFELSLDGEAWSGQVTIPKGNGVVEPTAVYVRLTKGEPGTFTGSITNTTSGSGQIVSVSGECVNEVFETLWSIPSNAFSFTLPTGSNSSWNWNYWIDWGDGSEPENITSVTNPTHLYAVAGEYKIGIWGSFPHLMINNNSTVRSLLLEVQSWGLVGFRSFYLMFRGCNNLTSVPNTLTGHEQVTIMDMMFHNCSAFNADIGGWNTENVTSMISMFSGCTIFNQDIGAWNTEKVINMGFMFEQCSAFNADIGGWNTANVTSMVQMFYGCTAFNQDIGGWNTWKVASMNNMFGNCAAFNANIGAWNTANVTNMAAMFTGCGLFNQDIGNWNTGKVQRMDSMFRNCSSFNADIGGWNTEKVTNMDYLFNDAIVFNQNLSGWDISLVTSYYRFDFGATAWQSGYKPIFT
jgi:surface protein